MRQKFHYKSYFAARTIGMNVPTAVAFANHYRDIWRVSVGEDIFYISAALTLWREYAAELKEGLRSYAPREY